MCVLVRASVYALQVLDGEKQWWLVRNRNGHTGYVPCNVLEELKTEETPYNRAVFFNNQVNLHFYCPFLLLLKLSKHTVTSKWQVLSYSLFLHLTHSLTPFSLFRL